jgi:hypothetical protein
MSKKAQITMFVILGLILLILVVMFFGFINQLKQKPTSVKKIIDELETGRLKDHVTNCMAKVGVEGLEKLGANGGVIYRFEGGNIPLENKVLGIDYLNYSYLGQTYFVAYGLRKNTNCSWIDHTVLGYPFPGASIDQLNQIYEDYNCSMVTSQSGYDGFFGQIVMNKLCILARQFEQPYCEGFANGEIMGLTIQAQLENYIREKLPLCIDFDEFIQRLDANVTVDFEPVVETNIHDAEILFTVKYPITISFDNKEPITQIISYQTTLNVRLARVYNFLHNALLQEAKFIDANIATDYTVSDVYYKEGIELTRIRAPCIDCQAPYKYDDIIEVTDRNSSVNGKPFVFRVAIENRRPILEPIPDQEINSVNDILQVPLRAQDPDDTTINYRFVSSGYGRVECGVGIAGAYQDPPCSSNTGGWCSNNPNPAPGSPSLLSIPITEYDYGMHEVGILAIDEAGLFDYQMFNINVIYNVDPTAPDTASCMSSCTDWDYIRSATYGCQLPPPFDNSLDYPYPADVYGYCEKWCEAAANPCSSVCDFANSDSYSLFWDSCRACVLPIVNSRQPNQYNCQQYNGDRYSCIANMPNCYLILEKSRYDNSFIEFCYDIINFDLINPPALILTS